jgi:hypothetical protein
MHSRLASQLDWPRPSNIFIAEVNESVVLTTMCLKVHFSALVLFPHEKPSTGSLSLTLNYF